MYYIAFALIVRYVLLFERSGINFFISFGRSDIALSRGNRTYQTVWLVPHPRLNRCNLYRLIKSIEREICLHLKIDIRHQWYIFYLSIFRMNWLKIVKKGISSTYLDQTARCQLTNELRHVLVFEWSVWNLAIRSR